MPRPLLPRLHNGASFIFGSSVVGRLPVRVRPLLRSRHWVGRSWKRCTRMVIPAMTDPVRLRCKHFGPATRAVDWRLRCRRRPIVRHVSRVGVCVASAPGLLLRGPACATSAALTGASLLTSPALWAFRRSVAPRRVGYPARKGGTSRVMPEHLPSPSITEAATLPAWCLTDLPTSSSPPFCRCAVPGGCWRRLPRPRRPRSSWHRSAVAHAARSRHK